MISWGIALLGHVPVSNKEGIYATRFLLGLVSRLGSSNETPIAEGTES